MLWLALLQIKSSEPEERIGAVKKLARSDGARVFTALADATHDEDTSVRVAAVNAIGTKPGEQTVPLLLEALQDVQPEVRLAAISGLKDRVEERVRALLIDTLSDIDPGVRAKAAQTLERQKWRPTNAKDEMWFAIARGHLSTAAKHGPAAIEPLEMVLKSGTYNLQVAAVHALAEIGDERVLKLLIPALKSADQAVCVAAVEALCRFGGPKAAA